MAKQRPSRVRIDLSRIRRNTSDIAARVGVPVWAVVKANAYGLGAMQVARAVAGIVGGFCVFTVQEAVVADLQKLTGKPVLALGPPTVEASVYNELHIRPCVSSLPQAAALRAADPVLNVDTGMQRFCCPLDQVEAAITAGHCREAMTHASRVEQAESLLERLGDRGLILHAAASALLDEPRARLDLVRPGLAMYRGAVKVTAPLVEVHDTTGPAGYTRFVTARHGVILMGYSHGLRAGRCDLNGARRRVLEVGMQSAFIEIGPTDAVGDDVVLLGDEITEVDLASDWRCTPHEVLIRLSAGTETREYVDADD